MALGEAGALRGVGSVLWVLQVPLMNLGLLIRVTVHFLILHQCTQGFGVPGPRFSTWQPLCGMKDADGRCLCGILHVTLSWWGGLPEQAILGGGDLLHLAFSHDATPEHTPWALPLKPVQFAGISDTATNRVDGETMT